MALRPGSAQLTYTSAAGSSILYVDEVVKSVLVEPFTRVEFSNDKLRSAKNDLGGQAIITTTIANTPIQVNISCTGDSPRPLTPDSLANLNSINQRLNITRFTIRGASCPVSSLVPLTTQAFGDSKLLLKFQYHQTQANSDISYNDLVGLQAETFSYLTGTTTALAGNCLGGTASSLIVRSYSEDVVTSVTQADGSQLLMASFSAVFDNISISSQSAS